MAGPFDIQRPAIGLLDLFGLKATGDSPHMLGQEIRATVEVGNLYLLDRMLFDVRATAVAPVAVGFLGLTINTGPPPGALWLLYSASLQVSQTAAATGISMMPVIRRGLGALYEGLTAPMLLGASQGGIMGGLFYNAPIIMRPNDSLGVFTSSVLGVPVVTAVMSYSYVELGR